MDEEEEKSEREILKNVKESCNKSSNNVLISSASIHSLQTAAVRGESLSLQVPAAHGSQPLETEELSSLPQLAQQHSKAGSLANSRKRKISLESQTANESEQRINHVASCGKRFAAATTSSSASSPPTASLPSSSTSQSETANSVFEDYVASLPELERTATRNARISSPISSAAASVRISTSSVPEKSDVCRPKLQQRLLEISETTATGEKSESRNLVENYFTAMTAVSVPKFTGVCGSALCFAMNPVTGSMVQIRALLDSGANLTMLNREVAKAIGLTGKKVALNINVAGGGSVACNESEVVFRLVKKDKTYVTPSVVGITTESVGNPFSPVDFRPERYAHLRDLNLADKFPAPCERPFQLLLSEPYFSLLERPGRRLSEDPSLPVAVNTDLGWVLRGAAGIQRQVQHASVNGVLANDHETFDLDTMYKSIGFDFGKFWSGENVGIQANESMTSDLTALEIQAEAFQKQTARSDAQKRQWSVHLPWINQDPEARVITDNTSRAVAMWHKVLRSVKDEHMPMVEDAYEELLSHGFAEKVPDHEIFPDHPTYVMTSRPVFRFDKTTTKCRIVINASLPDQKDPSKSLNKLLMPGPNKLPQIMMLVLRTMIKEHLVLIDVKKMFLAIQLEKLSDKDMLRFVWAKPGSNRPDLLRYRVLAFGVVSSPFQAIWCLHETAKMFLKKYPVSAQIILDMTYMDDINITANSIVEAKKLTMEILEILDHGGFYGHKISASDPQIVDELDAARLDQSRVISVLGLKLNHDTCEFMFDLDDKFDQFDAEAEKITRTDVVSLASKIFDTQGFVSPYIMQYKKILPMLWQNKTTWTENLKTKKVINENGQKVDDEVA